MHENPCALWSFRPMSPTKLLVEFLNGQAGRGESESVKKSSGTPSLDHLRSLKVT